MEPQTRSDLAAPTAAAPAPTWEPGPASPDPAPAVTVVVVNWNGREHLAACLEGLACQTYPHYQVVVVDNGSTDGSPELLAADFPQVALIRNSENRGFAAATNQGIRASQAPYIATLNNDAVPEPGWLAALVARAETDPGLGSVASKMVFADSPGTINSCGIALDRAGIAWDLDGGRPAHLVDRPREVFGACAGAALYRRAMLDDVGLFDEDFFAYLEDVDLAWRARLRGWRCALAADAVVRHVHSATLGDASARKRFLLGRNKVWTLAKCLPAQDGAGVALAVAYEALAVAWRAAHADWPAVAGRLAGLATLPRVWPKRRWIQAGRRAGLGDLRAALAPPALPWRAADRYRHLATRGASGGPARSQPLRPAHLEEERPTWRARTRLVFLQVGGWLLRLARRRSARGRSDRPAAHASAQQRGPGAPSPPQRRPPLRVLVVRPDHLGDVLLSRPALERLQLSLPEAEVTAVVGPWGASSLRGIGCRVVSFPFPGFTRAPKGPPWAPYTALAAFAAHLARERFDAAVLLRPDHWWGALACAVASIPVRVGAERPELKPFLTHPIALAPERVTATAVRLIDHLVQALGGQALGAPAPVTFPVDLQRRKAMGRWLDERLPGQRPRVAIHPGAGAGVKLWPPRRWAAVAQALAAEGAGVVLTGGPQESALLAAIQGRLAPRLPAADGLSWEALAALYANLDLVLGLDSGPLHLAAAVGTPTVRVYGPSDPAVYGPAGDATRHRALASPLACAPCRNLLAPPCGYLLTPPCLAAVAAESLLAAARSLLAEVPVR